MCADPGFDFVGKSLGFSAGYASRNEQHELSQHVWRLPQLLLQRGSDDQVRAEPVIEVFPKVSLLHGLGQITIGRSDNLAGEMPLRCIT